MPGSLLNLGRSRLTRHDSTRSDISTYSNDSKKRVSFNKAVRVKKYTRSEDGNDPRRSGRKFWFKVYEDDELDAGRWEEYSGDEGKGSSDDRLKTIDESSSIHAVDADSTGGSDVRKIIEKFNQQSLGREGGHAGTKYDSLTKYKRNSILNGMKSLFGSTSFRNKKKNSSVQDRNLENLFRSHNDENIPNGDLAVQKTPDDLWTPKAAEKHSYSETDLEKNNSSNSRDNKTVVDVEKWESGDQLVFDARQYDKSIEKTDDGELRKTVEQGDKIWKNITRTITYAESSPKIIRKSKARTNGSRADGAKAFEGTEISTGRSRPHSKSSIKRDTGAQCTQSSDSKSKNTDKYKVIRSRNGVVSAYSNVPPLGDDTNKTSRITSLDIERITRPTTCKRDHRHNDTKRETSALTKSKLYHADNLRKSTGDYSPSVISRDASHRRTEPKSASRSDYRRGYSTLSAHRRGSRNRARSHEDRIPNISGVKILVNGESVEEGSVRGGLAAAYRTRQRGRTSSASPVREFKSYEPSSDQNSEYNHETVVLYIPGVSHQEKSTDEEERISGATVTRSQSMSAKRPSRHKKYDSLRGGLNSGNFDDEDEMNHFMENKEISPSHNKHQRDEYRTLARV